ncbi:hypothetical protein CQW23_33006 [Capsicum baccatum]|uniref:Uncharacterized protein n=1 Tax=Capsicum baccatum TaxID=33114 RepID=A0A2G2V337_CAPBA|nr:hypothetical protein CQW23_33006 [Capsicum baccatum]
MKTPLSPSFAFRSQDTPQTPASGLKYQQASRSPTSGFKSQQPSRSPTSGFKSQQPPRSPTSGFKSQQAPRSPTSAAIKSQKPLTSSTHGKGSQIRRSLRTIGKLINGSDRKKQQKMTGPAAPLSPFSCQNEEKSSTASNARTLRRQSLTGIPLPTMLRRSSLRGGSVPDSCTMEPKARQGKEKATTSQKSKKKGRKEQGEPFSLQIPRLTLGIKWDTYEELLRMTTLMMIPMQGV